MGFLLINQTNNFTKRSGGEIGWRIEIDYDVLFNKNKSIYTQLLINNLVTHKVEIDKKNLTKYLYAHVNRGVNIIYTNKLKDISGLLSLK